MAQAEIKPKRRGAPITERRRVPMGLRVAPELRDDLVDRSAHSGRSLTQELEALLQHGLIISKMMSGSAPMLQALMEFDRAGSRVATERGLQADWLSDPDCYMAAANAAIYYLIAHTPGPWDGKALFRRARRKESRRYISSPRGWFAQSCRHMLG